MASAKSADAEYDVVIVGGGSAGCVVAARVTEDPAISLCLVEAGGWDRHPWIHIPMGFGKVVVNPSLNWGYETEPEPELNGRRINWPRGKVVGGSGSINGLVFLRGLASDFDDWERRGARGWGYKDVLPYFKRMEHNVNGADTYRGQGGPMAISDIRRPSSVATAFVQSCEHLQYARNPDFNGERIDGVGFAPLNVRNGWRCSTAKAYLKPNLKRRNLTLLTKSRARRIIVKGKRAIGIEIERDGRIERIDARRELVLCGGAINSPTLLLASGIGPPAELKALGIPVRHELPGVGKNLQDHLFVNFVYRSSSRDTLNEVIRSPVKFAKSTIEWLVLRSGSLAVGATEATLFAKSNPSELLPDLQFQCINFSSDGLKNGLHEWPGFSLIFNVCRPKSRGEIRLQDADSGQPRIFANYMTDSDDVRRMVAGFRITRQIAATEPLRSLIIEAVRPKANCVSDEQIVGYCREVATTVFHPCGTCRIGEDDMAVVDSQLRVRGMENLRVVDASVMPTVPTPNIQPATIMVAEKGSDLIRERSELG